MRLDRLHILLTGIAIGVLVGLAWGDLAWIAVP